MLHTFGDSFTAGYGCKFETTGIFSKELKNSYYYKTYKNYIDSNKKIWPELVADHFGITLNNLGNNGNSTETILDVFIKNISKIDKNDIVIIQTSVGSRWDFPFPKEKDLFGLKKYTINNDVTECFESPYRFKVIFPSNIEAEWEDGMEYILNYTNGEEAVGEKSLKLNKTKYDTIRNFFTEFIISNKYYERTMWRIVELSKVLRNIGYKIYIINEDVWPIHLQSPDFHINLHENGLLGYCAAKGKTIFYDTNGEISDWHPSYGGHEMIANDIINFIKNENINIH